VRSCRNGGTVMPRLPPFRVAAVASLVVVIMSRFRCEGAEVGMLQRGRNAGAIWLAGGGVCLLGGSVECCREIGRMPAGREWVLPPATPESRALCQPWQPRGNQADPIQRLKAHGPPSPLRTTRARSLTQQTWHRDQQLGRLSPSLGAAPRLRRPAQMDGYGCSRSAASEGVSTPAGVVVGAVTACQLTAERGTERHTRRRWLLGHSVKLLMRHTPRHEQRRPD
jgi:hypothetical protein